ncbi:hypothetical protein C0J52_27892, partial [Blattella germanica]
LEAIVSRTLSVIEVHSDRTILRRYFEFGEAKNFIQESVVMKSKMPLPPRRIRRFGRQTSNAVNIQRCRVNQVSLTTDDVSRIDNDLSREFSDSAWLELRGWWPVGEAVSDAGGAVMMFWWPWLWSRAVAAMDVVLPFVRGVASSRSHGVSHTSACIVWRRLNFKLFSSLEGVSYFTEERECLCRSGTRNSHTRQQVLSLSPFYENNPSLLPREFEPYCLTQKELNLQVGM